jgi:hypothetical protein
VLAGNKYIRVLNMRNLPPDILVQLPPELPRKRLRLGIRRPVVAAVFVLTTNLAAITSLAVVNID